MTSALSFLTKRALLQPFLGPSKVLPSVSHDCTFKAHIYSTGEPPKDNIVKNVNEAPLASEADVVICGGGILGCSVAYHLALRGQNRVVLLEQGSLTGGTTWHSVGALGRLRGTPIECEISDYSVSLYKDLNTDGYHSSYQQTGSLNLARTKDRLIQYKRELAYAKRLGIEGHVMTPKEIQETYPYISTEDLEGGVYVPHDVVVYPPDVTMALAAKSRELGVQIHERCQVEGFEVADRSVQAVHTNKGTIQCQSFVNCAGMWARELGQMTHPAVKVPLHPCEHFYMITKPVETNIKGMPFVRDYDGFVYVREWGGGVLGGGFEPRGKPVFSKGIPQDFEFQLLPDDWDHFQILLEQILHRIPILETAQVKQMINGPESFTPDGKSIVGRASELKNYFVAAGFGGSGIVYAGGVGKLLAEWIMTGDTIQNLWPLDVRRFVDLHNNKKFLEERVKESLGSFTFSSPVKNFKSSRRVKMSPTYSRFVNAGAVFDQFVGYERSLYFSSPFEDDVSRTDYDSVDSLESETPNKGSFGKPVWFDNVKSEYWACRQGVCIIDMSTFSKYEMTSASDEVVDFLQYVCANTIDRPVGTVIHTGMLNERGGFENDCSLVRLAPNKYFMISPTAQQTRSLAWLTDHLPASGAVQISDVTSMYTAINVLGPKAEELLSDLTDIPLDRTHFPQMTCQEIDVGQASGIKAMRLTHSGEDGFMLYVPSEYALHVYDSLMVAGKNFGVRNAGYYALRALRTEKFFAYWGSDLTPDVTPLECNREARVKFDVGGFIGHEALVKQRREGIKKRLYQFTIEKHNISQDPWPWGGESIYRNGKFCGVATSTAFGYTLNRHVVLGYVHNYDDDQQEQILTTDYLFEKNAVFEIEIAGEMFPAKGSVYPPKLPSAAIVV